jgi:hypothetical protein
MKSYDVTITAIVTKTIRVKAKSEDEAVELAQGSFDVGTQEGVSEKYEERVDDVEEVK